MPSQSGKVVAIIPAAGMGMRMGLPVPKQYVNIQNKPLLIYTLEKFQQCRFVDDILLVVSRHSLEETNRLAAVWEIDKLLSVVPGGKERQDSVREGLNALPEQTKIVVIHDAVRPFISISKIEEAIDAAEKHGASVLALPVNETIKKCNGRWVEETLDRDTLYRIQTPQCFLVQWIRGAHESAQREGFYATDDAALVERSGHPVSIIEGEEKNIKITSPSDLALAEWLMQEGKT